MRSATSWAVMGVLLAGTLGISYADPLQPVPVPAQPNSTSKAAETPHTPAKPKPISPAIAKLVADLGSDEYPIREQAGKELAKLGERALPDLRRALADTDNLEVSRRLSVLIRKLDYDRLVNPKRITLSVKDQSVKDILDALSRQTGYKLEFGGGRDDLKLSFEFNNVPFWPVLDEVAKAAGLSVNAGYDDDAVHLYQGNTVSPYVSYSGPFRLVASYISTSKNIQLANLNPNGFGNRGQEYINMSFQIFSEPKNPILGVNQVELITAEDETGMSLVPPKDRNNRTSHYYNQGHRSHNASANLSLVRGNRDATRITMLKGRVGVVLLAGSVPEIIVPDPVRVKSKKFTGRSAVLDIESLTANGKQYTLAATVSRAGIDPNRNDYSWANNVWQKIELIDEQGNAYKASYYNHINSTPTSVQMTIPFGPDPRMQNPPKLGPPVKLVFNEWQTVTSEIAFTFKGVPLP